jgi:hypothetical protein
MHILKGIITMQVWEFVATLIVGDNSYGTWKHWKCVLEESAIWNYAHSVYLHLHQF